LFLFTIFPTAVVALGRSVVVVLDTSSVGHLFFEEEIGRDFSLFPKGELPFFLLLSFFKEAKCLVRARGFFCCESCQASDIKFGHILNPLADWVLVAIAHLIISWPDWVLVRNSVAQLVPIIRDKWSHFTVILS
jgi:hypothetical protein